MTDQNSAGTPDSGKPKSSRLRRWLLRVVGGLALLLTLAILLAGAAEYKTSQSEFCSSCHIMEPYYDTWSHDIHGSKLDIACVECHYAPGERTTLKAKFRGLSQVTSYFSGRYGAGRPRAHVSNLSCLTAKCHGDLKFMDKPLQLGTVKFVHAQHLPQADAKPDPQQQRFQELQSSLKMLVGDEHFGELDAVAAEAGPAQARYDKLVSLCRQWDVPAERDALVEFSQLRHRAVRTSQLTDLQCTNCHSYHATDETAHSKRVGNHFQVSTSTCFTCHFNNEAFDVGTSSCLKCHAPPQGEITVHAEMPLKPADSTGLEQAATKLVKMNHTEILANKVSCYSCHADAIQKDAMVTRRDCERCHDQPRFFEQWKEPFTVDLVQHYHAVHVEQQRAKCLDCHAEIEHRLVHDPSNLLTSAMADCARCHPNHHAEQINLLLGRGGSTVPKSSPNLMFGARTNCTGCHTTAHGDVLKATEQSCVGCHGDRHKDTFEKWKLGIQLAMEDAESALQNAKMALEKAENAPEATRRKASELINSAESDLRLVKTANGLHNVAYAIELLDAVAARSREAADLLATQ